MSLVARYKMNDNAPTTAVLDTTGRYNGTLSSGTAAAISTAGRIGGALAFNGGVRVTTSSLTGFNGTTFTVATWLKSNGYQTAGLITKRDSLLSDSSGWMLSIANGNLLFNNATYVSGINWNTWSNQSITDHIITPIDSRISGLTKASPTTWTAVSSYVRGIIGDASFMRVFSTQDHATPNYVRATNCWAASLDLTCCSPWNSTGAAQRAGTLVTPRHIVSAQHGGFQVPVGATIRFVTRDNLIVTRTVRAEYSNTNTLDDMVISILDSDVPSSITFAKVLPDNYAEYLPADYSSYRIPGIRLDQEEKALIGDMYGLAAFQFPSDTKRQSFYEDIIGGDSGNPAFIVVDDELVLITTFHYGGGGSGPNITALRPVINTTLASLSNAQGLSAGELAKGSPYQLTPKLFGALTPTVDANWHHVAASVNGTTVKFYVDGVLKQTSTIPAITTNASPVCIAGTPSMSSSYFSGVLDDARIYDSVLDQTQITQLYQTGNFDTGSVVLATAGTSNLTLTPT